MHRYVHSTGLQTVQELLATMRVSSASTPAGAGGLKLDPLSVNARSTARSAQQGVERRDAQRDGGGGHQGITGRGLNSGAGTWLYESIQVARRAGVMGDVAMATVRLSKTRLRARDPDKWRVPGSAVDYFLPPGGLEGNTKVSRGIYRDLEPGARRFHVPAVNAGLRPGGHVQMGDSADSAPPVRAGKQGHAGGSWRFSGAGEGQFSGHVLGSDPVSGEAARGPRLAPWRAGAPHLRHL